PDRRQQKRPFQRRRATLIGVQRRPGLAFDLIRVEGLVAHVGCRSVFAAWLHRGGTGGPGFLARRHDAARFAPLTTTHYRPLFTLYQILSWSVRLPASPLRGADGLPK